MPKKTTTINGRSRKRDVVPASLDHTLIDLATVPVSIPAEHALIDADADLFLATQHRKLEMARTLLAAVAFEVEAERCETKAAEYAGMLVRLPNGGGA